MSTSEALISEVFKRPVLWDSRTKGYHNRDLVDKEWNTVSRILGISKDVSKSKWKSRRDNFRKEIKKIEKPRSGDSAQPPTPRWVHFNAMEFLKDIMEPKKTSGNISTEENPQTEDASEEENIIEDASEVVDTDPTLTSEAPSPPISKRPKSFDYRQEMIKLEKKKMEWMFNHGDKEKEEDDNLNFFKSLLPYMKKLPPLKKLCVRTQIHNMLFNELNTLELQNNFGHSSTSPSHSAASTSTDNASYHLAFTDFSS